MKTRLITSFLGALLFFAVLFAPPIVFQAAVVIVVGIATYEVYSVTGMSKKAPLAVTGAFGIIWSALLGCMHLNDKAVTYDMCLLCLVIYGAVLFALMVFDHKEIKLSDAATGFFVSVLIGLLYSFIIPLREGEYAPYVIVALFAATWCNDAGAYFVGIKFGKHKLAPVLSPKKTIEGAVGGVAGSIIAMVIFNLVTEGIFKVPCNTPALIFTGLGCSVLGPVADIATSAIKREFGVKDYGNLFPGHGGILDRFDSVLLTAPFVYFMNEWFTLVG